jgi:DNA polymerase III subunit delta
LSQAGRDAIRIEVSMATHLLSGNDESVLRSAVHELVDELVGDGDRALMVDEFDGDDYELRSWSSTQRRRRRSSPTSAWWWRVASAVHRRRPHPLIAYLADPLDVHRARHRRSAAAVSRRSSPMR